MARTNQDYAVGWICALEVELAAARALLKPEYHDLPLVSGDPNRYHYGSINGHNVVIACLPDGEIGKNSAAAFAARMAIKFPSLKFCLMVGIGGGAPSPPDYNDVRLGDVVVSSAAGEYGGVVQFDRGNTIQGEVFIQTGSLNRPSEVLRHAVSDLRATYTLGGGILAKYLEEIVSEYRSFASPTTIGLRDILFKPDYDHPKESGSCTSCDTTQIVRRSPRSPNPVVHYGVIASSNRVMRNGLERDRISQRIGGVLCFEMEAGRLMNIFPCLIIRGICDYSDSHKNKRWQKYAAAVAAAYAKELLGVIKPIDVIKLAGLDQIQTSDIGLPRSQIASYNLAESKEALRLLLSANFNIEANDFDSAKALSWAAKNGHETVARHLVEKVEHINAKDNDEWTALHFAARYGHEAVVQVLLQKRAYIEAKSSDGNTALHLAAQNGQEKATLLLIQKGAYIEAKSDEGKTALHLAAWKGHEAVARLLVEKGAQIEAKNNFGNTALHLAALKGHEAVARLLVEKGAQIEAKLNNGETALHFAARDGHEAVARLLIEKGAQIEATFNNGVTALHFAARDGHEAVARLLIEKGAQIEAKSDEGNTALHFAAWNGQEAVARLLVEKGAQIESKNIGEYTALHLAARDGHGAVVRRLLVEKGAQIEARLNNGETALHFVARDGHEAVARLLVEKGAQIEAKDSNGETALHFAVRDGHEAAARLLVEKGVQTEAKNNDEYTALHLAAQDGREAVARLLAEKGAVGTM